MYDARLRLETLDGAFVISLSGTNYSVTFRRLNEGRGITAMHSVQAEEGAPITPNEFLERCLGCSQGQGEGVGMDHASPRLGLQRAEYDRDTQRAYVEFRGPDDDGGDAIATAIFSYRTSARLSKKQVHEEIVRKARHLLKKAAAAT